MSVIWKLLSSECGCSGGTVTNPNLSGFQRKILPKEREQRRVM
jgi:hypothetical protein